MRQPCCLIALFVLAFCAHFIALAAAASSSPGDDKEDTPIPAGMLRHVLIQLSEAHATSSRPLSPSYVCVHVCVYGCVCVCVRDCVCVFKRKVAYSHSLWGLIVA